MRIAITTTMIQRGESGVGQYVFNLVRELTAFANEHQFTLYVLEKDRPLFEFAAGKTEIVPVAEKWRPALRNVFWHQAVLPFALSRGKIDVLHVPSYRRMVRFTPCARIATIHDLAPFHVEGKYDPARMFYGKVIARHLARHQHAIIAVSTHTARDIGRFFKIPGGHVEVILNGLNHARFRPPEGGARWNENNGAPWGLERPFFLYVSRLEHPGKNHLRLIEAFNQFKEETGSDWLLALGGSDWHGASHIHAAVRSSPFANDIHRLGFVPEEALPGLYRAAGALVYPSLFEGFGLPPVEAMASGCPVLCSARGSLDEVIGDAAERIDPEDPGSIAQALARVASDEALRSRLIALGLENARRFDWKANAARVVKLYEGLENHARRSKL